MGVKEETNLKHVARISECSFFMSVSCLALSTSIADKTVSLLNGSEIELVLQNQC
jgi:hypothetical protein